MKSFFLLTLPLVLSASISAFANGNGSQIPPSSDTITDSDVTPRDWIGRDKEHVQMSDGYGKPESANCRDEKSVLDQTGCLDANGSTSKHCKVLKRGEPCSDTIVYRCRDFIVCMKKEKATELIPSRQNGGEAVR